MKRLSYAVCFCMTAGDTYAQMLVDEKCGTNCLEGPWHICKCTQLLDTTTRVLLEPNCQSVPLCLLVSHIRSVYFLE